jgi:hypothetical protein
MLQRQVGCKWPERSSCVATSVCCCCQASQHDTFSTVPCLSSGGPAELLLLQLSFDESSSNSNGSNIQLHLLHRCKNFFDEYETQRRMSPGTSQPHPLVRHHCRLQAARSDRSGIAGQLAKGLKGICAG